MIRTAKFGDIPRIVELMQEMHERSVFRDEDDIDVKEAKAVVMRAIQRSVGKHHVGSAFVSVAESKGVVEGYLIGSIGRLHEIGFKAMACVNRIYVSKSAHPRDAFLLIDAFTRWATKNSDVIRLYVDATDEVGVFERTSKLYQRKGFETFGFLLRKRVNEAVNV